MRRRTICLTFRHARASNIEFDISYGYRILRIRIRDDGIGMILISSGNAVARDTGVCPAYVSEL